MSYVNKKSKLSVLLMASLIATNFAFAADSFKNNVVDVKVNKEPGDAVKVTIYTDKPYTDPVVVNKKANNKYVILMPETNSSLKSSPSVSDVVGTVSNVSVNTQSVNGGKGYTKIIITSEKAITVVPRTQQLSSAAKSKDSVSSMNQIAQKEALAKKAAELKAQQEKAKKLAQEKAQKEAQAKKDAELKAQQERARKLAQEKAQREAQARKDAELKAQQERARKLAQEKNQNVNTNSDNINHPIEVLEKEIQTNKTANLVSNPQGDAFLEKEINDNMAKQDKKVSTTSNLPVSLSESLKIVLKDYDNISIWKILLLASAITFPLLVIFLIFGMDKKIKKRIDKTFKKEEDVLPVVDRNTESSSDSQQVYSSMDDLLNKVEETPKSFHEEQIMRSNLEQQLSEVQDTINSVKFENDFVKEDFDNINEVFPDENAPIQQNSTVDDSHVSAGMPEVVEQIKEDDISNEEHIVSENNLPVSQEPYAPDGFLSDFAGVDDKEFFDEIVIQTMAENNAGGLPEETDEDKIFNHVNDDEDTIAEKYQQIVDGTYSDKVSNQESSLVNVQNDVVESVDDVFSQDSLNVVSDPEPEQPVSAGSDLAVSDVIQDESDDELVMLNQVEISNSAGMYLVDYENYSSLVGYVDDNYFVLKKFASHVNSNIILKPTEKLEESTRYLVKVGKDKMIVEVDANSMNRLLDL